MSNTSRRSFLQVAGSVALSGGLPGSIERALALPAAVRTGTIKDVEHIIILTQENRSFDHYFGTMRGVRGFSDPRAVRLPSGKSVWHQPNGSGEVLPFRPPVTDLGMTFLSDPPHGWNDTHAAWNGGWHDQWVPNKGVTALTYHTRKDLPYHFALADAFTVCDAYHCSLMGPTDPNRYHMWTGWVGNDGSGGGPVITNAEAGYGWSTYPERLQRAGVTWKVYQDTGTGLNADSGNWWGWTGDPYIGNYGDNALLYFHQYQDAQPGNPLADFGKTGTSIVNQDRDPLHLLDIFRADVRAGKLPQVSWIAAPEAYSEHPNFPANYGAWYISQVLNILTANPDVWSKTVVFINYDEEGGFFDHMVPPTPPQNAAQGASTVSTVNEIFPGDASHPSAPYGLGMRVPLLAISPWSKGGYVNSQVFDHTSLIRFLEARFGDEYPGLRETNITPWRRAVTGDLTSVFNFATPNDAVVHLPSTKAFLPVDKVRQDDYPTEVPANQMLPRQERGQRPARALPYALHTTAKVQTGMGAVQLQFANIGQAAAVFHVRANVALGAPRTYTVEPGKQLSGQWLVKSAGQTDYALEVHGPNGFLRAFKGGVAFERARLDVQAVYDVSGNGITLVIHNPATTAFVVNVADRYGKRNVVRRLIGANESFSVYWALADSQGWYDLRVSVLEDLGFLAHLAGHVETGSDSASDPALGGTAS